ncbi:MAG: pectin esterase [Acidobacteriota bacterium]|nr:pectin esterase [Acidobacteriota bacterium]
MLSASALLLCLPALAADVHVRVDPAAPHADPGNEGLTVFPTIQNALDHHPFATPNADGTPGRVFIEITPGTYHERIIVTQNHTNITLLGMGKSPEEVVITNSLNAKTAGGTFFTETAEINGDGFEADNLTLENSAGNTGQAVAAAVRADRVVFKHCRFLGHQDTLFADYGRQYYVDSYLEGGVDYIFGNATAVFERDELHSNGPGFITAQSRTAPDQTTGYVILNSKVTSTSELGGRSIGLGRPWRAYSRVVYLNTSLPAELAAAGWNNWGKTANEATAYYAEYHSSGPGANDAARVPWAHQLTQREMQQYLPQHFLGGPAKGPGHWDAVAAAAKLR